MRSDAKRPHMVIILGILLFLASLTVAPWERVNPTSGHVTSLGYSWLFRQPSVPARGYNPNADRSMLLLEDTGSVTRINSVQFLLERLLILAIIGLACIASVVRQRRGLTRELNAVR
jgi:hypothetical protein